MPATTLVVHVTVISMKYLLCHSSTLLLDGPHQLLRSYRTWGRHCQTRPRRVPNPHELIYSYRIRYLIGTLLQTFNSLDFPSKFWLIYPCLLTRIALVLWLAYFAHSFINLFARREGGMAPGPDPIIGLSRHYYALPIFMAQPNFQSVLGIRRR